MAKILLACHQFFPRYYTGTETLTLEVAEELRRRHHEVAILTTEPILPMDFTTEKAEIKKDVYEGFTVFRLFIPSSSDPVERLNRESYESDLTRIFDHILDEYSPDIVHAFHLMRLTLTLVESVKKRNIPLYLTVTDFWLICPSYQLIRSDDLLCEGQNSRQCFVCLTGLYTQGMPKVPLKFRLAQKFPWFAARFNKSAARCQEVLEKRIIRHKRIMESLDGVIWANKFIKDMFNKNRMQNKKEYIIPFPLPEKARGLMDLPMAGLSGPLKVAFIGTIRHSKGPQVLLKACELLADTGYNEKQIDVSIWGSADNKSFETELKKSIEKTRWINFCGTFPQERFPNVLQEIHVVVIPSLWYENTPLTAISVLAARRVLIVSNLGGLSTLVEDGVSGFTFSAGDYRQLASILIKIIKNKEIIDSISKAIPGASFIKDYVDRILGIHSIWKYK